MDNEHSIRLFENKKVRVQWVEEEQKWYFSVVDVVEVLTNSENPQTYWRVLKMRLKDEGNETVTNCNAFKMIAPDGKMRLTDVADTEQLLRIIQSIPSPKAEPFKIWLAKVGYQRIEDKKHKKKGGIGRNTAFISPSPDNFTLQPRIQHTNQRSRSAR